MRLATDHQQEQDVDPLGLDPGGDGPGVGPDPMDVVARDHEATARIRREGDGEGASGFRADVRAMPDEAGTEHREDRRALPREQPKPERRDSDEERDEPQMIHDVGDDEHAPEFAERGDEDHRERQDPERERHARCPGRAGLTPAPDSSGFRG